MVLKIINNKKNIIIYITLTHHTIQIYTYRVTTVTIFELVYTGSPNSAFSFNYLYSWIIMNCQLSFYNSK